MHSHTCVNSPTGNVNLLNHIMSKGSVGSHQKYTQKYICSIIAAEERLRAIAGKIDNYTGLCSVSAFSLNDARRRRGCFGGWCRWAWKWQLWD